MHVATASKQATILRRTTPVLGHCSEKLPKIDPNAAQSRCRNIQTHHNSAEKSPVRFDIVLPQRICMVHINDHHRNCLRLALGEPSAFVLRCLGPNNGKHSRAIACRKQSSMLLATFAPEACWDLLFKLHRGRAPQPLLLPTYAALVSHQSERHACPKKATMTKRIKKGESYRSRPHPACIEQEWYPLSQHNFPATKIFASGMQNWSGKLYFSSSAVNIQSKAKTSFEILERPKASF